MTETALSPTRPVRWLADAFDAEIDPAGAMSLREKARLLNVAPSVLSKLARGKQAPSVEFMARVKRLRPNLPVEQFFAFDCETAKAA